jgi:transcriptional regulator
VGQFDRTPHGCDSDSSLRDERLPNSLLVLTFQRKLYYAPVDFLHEGEPLDSKAELLQGTLDLIVLNTLHGIGPMHGYGIARRIEQVSGDLLQMNQGTLYPALLRLQQKGWITSKWGSSENNRRARFYSITKSGKKQLSHETKSWEQMVGIIGRVLRGVEGA